MAATNVGRQELPHQAAERTRIVKRITEQRRQSASADHDVGLRNAGVDLLQLPIVSGPRNAKGAARAPVLTPVIDLNSGRDPSADHLDQEARAERPIGATPEIA